MKEIDELDRLKSSYTLFSNLQKAEEGAQRVEKELEYQKMILETGELLAESCGMPMIRQLPFFLI